MSSEIPKISTPDAILRIKQLIQNKQGDPGRLQYIAETLQKGRKLFHSDEVYLHNKIDAMVIPASIKKSKAPNDKIKNVKRLIALKFGDPGRLRFILQSLQKNKPLYHSDENYLESKIEQFNEFSEGKRFRRRVRVTPSQPEVVEKEFYEPAPEPITELPEQFEPEVIEEPEVEELQPVEETEFEEPKTREEPSLSPQKETSDIFDLLDDTHVTSEIKKEREKISKLKHEHEQLKTKRNELSQLIAYRQEYEIKINREKEILEKQIRDEQEKVKEKDSLVEELIKNQSLLIQTKTEREVFVEQIKVDKEKVEEELRKEQEDLEELKKEYQEFEDRINLQKSELDEQIKRQKEELDRLKEDSEE